MNFAAFLVACDACHFMCHRLIRDIYHNRGFLAALLLCAESLFFVSVLNLPVLLMYQCISDLDPQAAIAAEFAIQSSCLWQHALLRFYEADFRPSALVCFYETILFLLMLSVRPTRRGLFTRLSVSGFQDGSQNWVAVFILGNVSWSG